MTTIREFRAPRSRRYQVEFHSHGSWVRPTGPGFRTRLFALADALVYRSLGYDSRLIDTACRNSGKDSTA